MNKATRDVGELLNVRDRNTAFQVFDRSGNVVPLWQENILGRFLRELGHEVRTVFTGRYSEVMFSHNLISNVGHALANGRMSNQGSYSPAVNIGIGQNTSSAAATDQALGQEITTAGGARAAATASQVTTTVASDTTQLVKTFTFTGSFAVTEEAIFDSATAPTVTTLAAAITTTGQTAITVASGTGITNNDYVQIDNEICQVTAGGGTTSLTITRGQKGTTAATHLINVGVVDINTSGNVLAKQTFAVINVTSGMSLQITHDYQT
jgi:hypothetical protein